ncbi:MAG: TauD/TfdA family dioxygenase [Gammaproteobacteria bacterium]|nr:TauD/TfdA family dioxygenase [Gammaproteobacteria bacterium]MDE0444208.1 TauD/TfdA family dioxygenase [Gammaproteobacteria bacterium]
MRIAPSDVTLGATVTEVSLGALSDDEWRGIEDAFHQYAVLVFPKADLNEDEHIAFSRRFGPLERTLSKRTERQEISLLSNVAKDGSIAERDDALGLFLKGNRFWHTDSSFKKVAAKASLLRALEVPDSGGDTEWADMRAAWDSLDELTQTRLEGLVAVHSYSYSQGKVGGIALLTEKEREALPPVPHPLVRTHPATGRKSLYVGRHASHIIGMDYEPGRALLAKLTEDACQPPRIFRHQWRAGDIVAWDNRCVLHRGHPWPFEQPRVMRRTTVAGDGENSWAIERGRDSCRHVDAMRRPCG